MFLYHLLYIKICVIHLDSNLNRKRQKVFTSLLIMKENIQGLSQIMPNIVCHYLRFVKMQKSLLLHHSFEEPKRMYILGLIQQACVFPHGFSVSHHLLSRHLGVLIFHLIKKKKRKKKVCLFKKLRSICSKHISMKNLFCIYPGQSSGMSVQNDGRCLE